MRIRCFGCGKSVSTEVPDETIVRAAVICPECIQRVDSDNPDPEETDRDPAEEQRGSRCSAACGWCGACS